MNNFSEKVNLIWEIADLLRGDYKPREYVDVILPMTVFYRLDLAIADTRQAVRETYEQYQGRLADMNDLLQAKADGNLVWNTSEFDWQKLLQAPMTLPKTSFTISTVTAPKFRTSLRSLTFGVRSAAYSHQD